MISSVRRFGDYFASSLVGRTAETMFKKKVREFCTGFTPEHVRMAAESGKPFQDIISSCGFSLKPTSVDKLNPWQKHLLSLPDWRMMELVRESVTPEHIAILELYPSVAQGIIATVRSMVVT